MPSTEREVWYGVQVTHGTADEEIVVQWAASSLPPGVAARYAREYIEERRAAIEAGDLEAEDYEPMRRVRRTVIKTVGDWESV